MRFITLLKAAEIDPSTVPPALFGAIAQLGEEATKAGVLMDTGGLSSTRDGVTVRLSGGQVSILDGPYTEAKEVVLSYAVYDVKSKAEAVEWTRRFMQVHKDNWPGWEGEAEVRQVFGPNG
jgi:hypothetical protein